MKTMFRVYLQARRKKHGQGRSSVREALLLGLMARYVANGCRIEQHPFVGRPWRWMFDFYGNFPRSTEISTRFAKETGVTPDLRRVYVAYLENERRRKAQNRNE